MVDVEFNRRDFFTAGVAGAAGWLAGLVSFRDKGDPTANFSWTFNESFMDVVPARLREGDDIGLYSVGFQKHGIEHRHPEEIIGSTEEGDYFLKDFLTKDKKIIDHLVGKDLIENSVLSTPDFKTKIGGEVWYLEPKNKKKGLFRELDHVFYSSLERGIVQNGEMRNFVKFGRSHDSYIWLISDRGSEDISDDKFGYTGSIAFMPSILSNYEDNVKVEKVSWDDGMFEATRLAERLRFPRAGKRV